MAQIKADEAVKRALEIHQHKDDYCYLYGAKFNQLSESVFEYLWAAEPAYFARYNAAQKQAIKDFCKKADGTWKIAVDCSGFVSKCVGDSTWSGGLWENCTTKNEDPYQGKYGSVLYRKGHVALDIGYGFFLHFPTEGKSCEIGRIKDGLIQWEGTGEHYNVDYSEADNR